jgi:hypothetical protein
VRRYNTTKQLPQSQRRILELERKNESAVAGAAAAVAHAAPCCCPRCSLLLLPTLPAGRCRLTPSPEAADLRAQLENAGAAPLKHKAHAARE